MFPLMSGGYTSSTHGHKGGSNRPQGQLEGERWEGDGLKN